MKSVENLEIVQYLKIYYERLRNIEQKNNIPEHRKGRGYRKGSRVYVGNKIFTNSRQFTNTLKRKKNTKLFIHISHTLTFTVDSWKNDPIKNRKRWNKKSTFQPTYFQISPRRVPSRTRQLSHMAINSSALTVSTSAKAGRRDGSLWPPSCETVDQKQTRAGSGPARSARSSGASKLCKSKKKL